MRTRNPWVVLPFMWVGLVAMSVLVLATVIKPFSKDRALVNDAPAFLSTTGTIVESETEVVATRRTRHYAPVVSYTYTVNGADYRGSTLQPFRPGFRTSADARQYVSAFRVGSVATVYYDPADPERAVLRIEPGSETYQTRFVAACAAILGVGWVVMLAVSYHFLRNGMRTSR